LAEITLLRNEKSLPSCKFNKVYAKKQEKDERLKIKEER
jgi:hypothetical protein